MNIRQIHGASNASVRSDGSSSLSWIDPVSGRSLKFRSRRKSDGVISSIEWVDRDGFYQFIEIKKSHSDDEIVAIVVRILEEIRK